MLRVRLCTRVLAHGGRKRARNIGHSPAKIYRPTLRMSRRMRLYFRRDPLGRRSKIVLFFDICKFICNIVHFGRILRPFCWNSRCRRFAASSALPRFPSPKVLAVFLRCAMFVPRVRHIRVLLLKAAKDAAPPASGSMRV